MKVTNLGSELPLIHSDPQAIFWQTLSNPQQGRKYLSIALDSNNEQIFLKALHDIMDALVWDLEFSNQNC
ncbi:MAG: hypothetical protein ACFCU5_12335 [Pleurocapsa sp.]